MALDISSIYSGNASYFRDIKDRAFSALGRLESAALSAAFSSASLSRVTFHSPNRLDRVDISSLPSVSDFMSGVDSIIADSFPDAPSKGEIEKYKKNVWESTYLDNIQRTLGDLVSSMGLPDASYQDAIFDAGKERLARDLSDKIAIVRAETSASGFKYANGQTNALIERLLVDDRDAKTDINRKLIELVTNWAKDNLHFSLQQGTAVESVEMEFAYKYSSIWRELYMTQINAVLEKYKTQVAMAIAKLEGKTKALLARVEVMKLNSDIEAKDSELQFEKDRLELQQAIAEYNGTIQNLSNKASHSIQAASSQAVTSGNMVQAVSNSIIGVAK